MAKILSIDTSIQTYMQMLSIVVLVIGCILSGILVDKIGIVKAYVIFLNLLVLFKCLFFCRSDEFLSFKDE